VNDDKQHFIMRGELSFGAFGKLRVEDAFQLEVIVIVDVAHACKFSGKLIY
jgi:hypothetical protein